MKPAGKVEDHAGELLPRTGRGFPVIGGDHTWIKQPGDSRRPDSPTDRDASPDEVCMADAEMPKERSSLNGVIATSKDLMSLLRDLSLLVLAVLLLIFPKTFNTLLVDAGFEEGSIVGFKWKATLIDSDAALKDAQTTISRLQSQNDELAKALAESSSEVSDASLKERMTKLEQKNNQLRISSGQVQSSVAQTISASAPLVEKALSDTRVHAPQTVGFCYQEDSLKDGAQRYSVHCLSSAELCERLRGPNARLKQSACEFVDLTKATWKPRSGGFLGSWYESNSEPFGEPFPQVR
jgi:hypothetical protein